MVFLAVKTLHASRTLTLALAMIAAVGCNQEEFYEKEYLTPLKGEVAENMAPNEVFQATAANDGQSSTGNNSGSGSSNGSSTDPNSGSSSGSGVSSSDGSNSGSNSGPGSQGPTCSPVAGVDNYTQNVEQIGKVDILWVIDNSGSMANEQDALARNFDGFINGFLDRNVDFRMAITTTDASSSTKDGKLIGRVLTSADAALNEIAFKEEFKTYVRVGTGGSGVEKGLHTSLSFLNKNGASFLRQEAKLIVVYLSDEEDSSSESINTVVNSLVGHKGVQANVRAHSIVTVTPSNSQESIGNRYMAVANQTSGSVNSIHEDFYMTLSQIGDSILTLIENFATSHLPVDGSLSVKVNGVAQTQGWSFDSNNKVVVFDSNHVPTAGAQVELNYNYCAP